MEVTSSASGGDQKDKIWHILEQEPHRVFAAQGLAATLNPTAAKDPNQQQQLVNEILADLSRLVEEGKVREVAEGGFKARIFTNETRYIEHAFIGGMGNTDFRFSSPIFRLNIGVIGMYFIKSPSEENWMVLVRDTTGGTCFSLRTRLREGTYQIGNQVQEVEDKGFISIVGRYIEKKHVTITIRGDVIFVEDLKTSKGTRVDLLTEEGLTRYQEAAREFLKTVEPSNCWDPVSRGRYVLDQFLRHRQNLEVTFFGAAVDSILLQTIPVGSNPDPRAKTL